MKGPRTPQENIAGRLQRCEKTNETLSEERKPQKNESVWRSDAKIFISEPKNEGRRYDRGLLLGSKE